MWNDEDTFYSLSFFFLPFFAFVQQKKLLFLCRKSLVHNATSQTIWITVAYSICLFLNQKTDLFSPTSSRHPPNNSTGCSLERSTSSSTKPCQACWMANWKNLHEKWMAVLFRSSYPGTVSRGALSEATASGKSLIHKLQPCSSEENISEEWCLEVILCYASSRPFLVTRHDNIM